MGTEEPGQPATMSDSSQIAHMRKFILHEANEKADEVMVKAEQDYTMEKQRVVEDERLKIRKEFERRERGLNSQAKIDTAKESNRARISVLTKQSELIDEVVEDARGKLEAITQDKNMYTELLVGLLEQGLAKLKEEKVLIRCRSQDVAAVEAAIPKAIGNYSKTPEAVETSASVMKDAFLPDMFEGLQVSGGVLMMSESGKIKVNNTFNARLAIAAEVALPDIKARLFCG